MGVLTFWSRPKVYKSDVHSPDYVEINGTMYEECWKWGSWKYHMYRVFCPSEKGTASWTIKNIAFGEYEVIVSFLMSENRSEEVYYELWDLDIFLGEAILSQKGEDGMATWASLGVFRIMFGELTVKIRSSQSGYVVTQNVQIREKRP